MSTAILHDITLAVRDAAGGITRANGYETDVGGLVRVGVRSAAGDDYPCVLIHPGDLTVVDASISDGNTVFAREYIIEASMVDGGEDTADGISVGESLLADLLALYLALSSLDGSAVYVEMLNAAVAAREDGSTRAAARLAIRVHFVADLGDPYSED